MMRSDWAAALMIGSLALLCAEPAHAQTTGDTAEMNRLNEEGFIEFRAGRYEVAAKLFSSAYVASPDPHLKKNEAIAWFKAGRCDQAMPAANAFMIAADTNEPDRLEARSILANCRVEMARDAIKTANWNIAGSLLDEAESLQPDQYAMDQISIARVELAERKSSAPNGSSGRPSPVGWILVGSGAAIMGGTIVYWLLTIPDRDDSRNLPPTDPGYDRASRRARTSRWVVPLGIIGGAALTGIGVYVVLSGGGQRSDPAATAGLWYRW